MSNQHPSDRRGKEPFRPDRRKKKPGIFKPAALRWALVITGWTFVISLCMNFVSGATVGALGLVPALLVLLAFILLGIIFDILGIATATVSDKAFHSMASRRVAGSAQALRLIINAEKVSSFCNDVVGDISGIVSGSTSAAIVSMLVADRSGWSLAVQLLFAAGVASLTVGGKALGKSIAMSRNTQIVFIMGKIMYFFENIFKKITRRQ